MSTPLPRIADLTMSGTLSGHSPAASTATEAGQWLGTLAQHPIRVAGRSIWLIAEIALAAADYIRSVAIRPAPVKEGARRIWLQHTCRRSLRVFNLALRTAGPIPTNGLLVSNHLGYLDILILAATTPATFVAKSEVKQWPVIGWFASLAGTIFVHREKRTDTVRSANAIRSALDQGALVVLFPEGTSSGGDTVLPFKSALLAPAAQAIHPLNVCRLQFDLEDGSVSEEVCYWRDMTLVPHLLNLLGKRGVSASISFTSVTQHSADRKQLARQLHAEVLRLKGASVGAQDSTSS